jgi:DNA/RNA-binding domain of Phe-tRNA-synthetase-like protein
VNVNSKHIVYADNAQVLTWLWNHRDSKDACIPPATPEKIPVLLFADQAENGAGDAKGAINRFKEIMPNIGCDLLDEAVLTKDNPSVTFTVEAQASGSNT